MCIRDRLYGVNKKNQEALYPNTLGSNSVQFFYNGIEKSFPSIEEEQKHRSQYNSIEIFTEAASISKLSVLKPKVIFNYIRNNGGQIVRLNWKVHKIKRKESKIWNLKVDNNEDKINIKVENRDGALIPIYKFYGADEDLNTTTISKSNFLINDEIFSGDNSVIDLGTPILPVGSIVVVTSNLSLIHI